MGMLDAEDLADLRWHWRGAYVINGTDEVWAATRTDTGATLLATSAEGLRVKIREDYAVWPVPRPTTRAMPRKITRSAASAEVRPITGAREQ